MFSEFYQWAPVIAGAVVAALARRVPNAPAWAALLVASFIVSSIWWNVSGPMPAAFGAATNFAISLIMLRHARNRWEFYVIDGYCFMILADICWQFGAIPSHYWYAISLEAANWAILLLIGAMGIAERLHANGGNRRRTGYARGAGLFARHFALEARYPRWWRETE